METRARFSRQGESGPSFIQETVMAWNPTKDVAIVRDAANALNAPMAVIVYVSADGRQLGTASYGRTKSLCEKADELREHLRKAAVEW